MLTNKFINQTLGITESYQMPDCLMKILKDKEIRENVFDKFIEQEPDLSYDWFTQYFQEEHGDREKLKQDFTPDCICKIIHGMAGSFEAMADICSGTGGLTISAWNENKTSFFHCEELASRAIPILLFNLAIRGITGEVIHKNVLTNEIFETFVLKNNGKYSDIITEESTVRKFDLIVMNPPYSISWSGESDKRFERYGVPPKAKADYAFVLHGLDMLTDTGKLLAVLPHGVLFRGQKEGAIRKALIQEGLMQTVIGLPDNLFLNTGIPVCIIELSHGNNGTYFVDASKEFLKGKPQNNMSQEQIDMVLSACKMRKNIDKLSYLAGMEEISGNDFNLNIPRYVDTFEPEEVVDLCEAFRELIEIEKETRDAENEFFNMMKMLVGTNAESQKRLEKEVATFAEYIEERNGQLELKLW